MVEGSPLGAGIVCRPIKGLNLLICRNYRKRHIVFNFLFQHMPQQIEIFPKCRKNITNVYLHNLNHQSRTHGRRESATPLSPKVSHVPKLDFLVEQP